MTQLISEENSDVEYPCRRRHPAPWQACAEDIIDDEDKENFEGGKAMESDEKKTTEQDIIEQSFCQAVSAGSYPCCVRAYRADLLESVSQQGLQYDQQDQIRQIVPKIGILGIRVVYLTSRNPAGR